LLISNHNSFRLLFDKIASVYFCLKNIFIFYRWKSWSAQAPGNQHCANCIESVGLLHHAYIPVSYTFCVSDCFVRLCAVSWLCCLSNSRLYANGKKSAGSSKLRYMIRQVLDARVCCKSWSKSGEVYFVLYIKFQDNFVWIRTTELILRRSRRNQVNYWRSFSESSFSRVGSNQYVSHADSRSRRDLTALICWWLIVIAPDAVNTPY